MVVIAQHLFLKWQCSLSGSFERAILITMLSSLCSGLPDVSLSLLSPGLTLRNCQSNNYLFKRNCSLMWALYIPSIYSINVQWFVSMHIKLLVCKMSEFECSWTFALPWLNSIKQYSLERVRRFFYLLTNLSRGLGMNGLKKYKCCSRFIKWYFQTNAVEYKSNCQHLCS